MGELIEHVISNRERAGIASGRPVTIPRPVDQVAVGHEVIAYINHGRWVADCPNCNGAELLNKDEPRFYCLSCYNEHVGNRFVLVVWPAELEKLEDQLLLRPQLKNQNMNLGETLIDLVTENVVAGIVGLIDVDIALRAEVEQKMIDAGVAARAEVIE